MTTLKVNGNKIRIPSCYEGITTDHWQKIISSGHFKEPDPAKRDYFKVFCILSDTNFKSHNLTDEQRVTLENSIQWFVDQPFQFSKEIPKVLSVGKKIMIIPKDIGALGINQNVFLKQRIAESEYLEENISIAIATYLQPSYTGTKFDIDEALKLNDLIKELPIYLTYPIGFFLLSRVIKYGRTHTMQWLQILNSLKQILRRWSLKWLSHRGSTVTTNYQ